MRCTNLILLSALAGIPCVPMTSLAQVASPAPEKAKAPGAVDAAFAALPKYKLGMDCSPLETIAGEVVLVQKDQPRRAALAQRLALVLAGDATFEAKDFACRQLYVIGTDAEIPALAKLLSDEQLSHTARFALEALASPAADAALREALGTVQGRSHLGIITSLGQRRDEQSVAKLKEIVWGTDPAAAYEAAVALGRIASPAALEALSAGKATDAKLAATIADARLRCADQLMKAGKADQAAAVYSELRGDNHPKGVRLAALKGFVLAQPEQALPLLLEMLKSNDVTLQGLAASLATQLKNPQATSALAGALEGLAPSAKVYLIDALATRGDAAAKDAVAAQVKNDAEPVKVAALRAMAVLGSPSDLVMLGSASAGARGIVREAAQHALTRMRGKDVEPAMVAALNTAQPQVKVELIRALEGRGATTAAPALLEVAEKDASEAVRSAALVALRSLASEADYPALVQRLLAAKGDTERDAAKSAIVGVAGRFKDKSQTAAPLLAALKDANPANRATLLSVLPRLGSPQALDAIRGQLQSDNEQVKDAAITALADWPDATTLPDLLAIARNGNDTHKVLAIRGAVRVIGKPSQRPPEETIKLHQQALDACTRPDEKKLVLSGLGETKHPAALQLILPALSDDALKNEAAAAALKVSRSIAAQHKPEARGALEQIAAANVDDTLKNQARQQLEKLK